MFTNKIPSYVGGNKKKPSLLINHQPFPYSININFFQFLFKDQNNKIIYAIKHYIYIQIKNIFKKNFEKLYIRFLNCDLKEESLRIHYCKKI